MTTLDAALRYLDLGWSIIPIRAGTKQPAVQRWRAYQTTPAEATQVQRWFEPGNPHGLAVIVGAVSGGLVCRDFDVMGAYDAWAAEHNDLAHTLPTVATSRGRHVYARGDLAQVRQASKTGSGIIRLGDGELRADGGYCIVPPSLHPAGMSYSWLVTPWRGTPEVNFVTAGLTRPWAGFTERTQRTQEHPENRIEQKSTDAIVIGSAFDENELEQAIQLAILESLPSGPGQRHRLVFEFARALKAIPALAEADPLSLECVLRQWHELARPHIRTKEFEETIIDFIKAWDRIRFPKGDNPMSAIFERAMARELPAEAGQFEAVPIRQLVAFCRELQHTTGAGEFFLSCRTAGKFLGVSHVAANRYLFLLQQKRVLELVNPGSDLTRQAARYRYLGQLPQTVHTP